MVKTRRLAWLGVLLLVSCAGTQANVLHVQAGPGGLSSKRAEIHDRWLARTLSFGEVSLRQLDSTFEAQVMIQNTSPRDVRFEYRFVWYDAGGFEISPLASWIPATLGGSEARGFRSTAPGEGAVGFRCMLRKSHPVADMG